MRRRNFCFARRGQSLVELLIAMAIGGILVIGAALIIAPALRERGDTLRVQIVSGLMREEVDNARVFSEANWQAFSALQTGSGNHYYIVASTTPFTVATGTESLEVGTSTYSRYFYTNAVGRDSSGMIPGAISDSSTISVTVGSGWPGFAGYSATTYFTRSKSYVFHQTDWTGGPGQEGPITAVNDEFATSSGAVDYATSTGSIMLNL